MKLAQSYKQASNAKASSKGMGFALATDLNRPGVFLNAGVKDGLTFAQNMLTLHRIVCTNMIKAPKDNSAYQKWVEGEYFKELGAAIERKDIEGLMKKEHVIRKELQDLKRSIAQNINESRRNFMKLSAATAAFWSFLYKHDRDAWVVLDPVISVQPDAVIFEAFSLDESMYGRVTLPHQQLILNEPLNRGTTNIDFSQQLADEFDRVRSYRPLDLKVGYKDVEISTNLSSAMEKKIDLPDTWLKGFLEVQSASAMPKITLHLTPASVSDLLAALEQKKDNVSPKSLKFILEPDQKPQIEIEPWGIIIKEQEHIYTGDTPQTIRIWGRRRLMVLKDLLPNADEVQLELLGSGLPSFWRVMSKDIEMDLGLSGWSSNDWASQTNFSLMSNIDKINEKEIKRVASVLFQSNGKTAEEIAEDTGLDRLNVSAALQKLCSRGQAMFDFHKKFYRWRELFPENLIPKDVEENPAIKKAIKILKADEMTIEQKNKNSEGDLFIKGSINKNTKENDVFLRSTDIPDKLEGKDSFDMEITFDQDGRAIQMNCSCVEFTKTSMQKGPCSHLIALMKKSRKDELHA
tara:strand:- start:1192 stop:2919 length:1728 start_codon:yes stop_codon:yes gene_type:complete